MDISMDAWMLHGYGYKSMNIPMDISIDPSMDVYMDVYMEVSIDISMDTLIWERLRGPWCTSQASLKK